MSRKFSQKSQKTKIIIAKLKIMITLVVDFHSSITYLQSQKFLALVTTLKYFFQSDRKILSGPCMYEYILDSSQLFYTSTKYWFSFTEILVTIISPPISRTHLYILVEFNVAVDRTVLFLPLIYSSSNFFFRILWAVPSKIVITSLSRFKTLLAIW